MTEFSNESLSVILGLNDGDLKHRADCTLKAFDEASKIVTECLDQVRFRLKQAHDDNEFIRDVWELTYYDELNFESSKSTSHAITFDLEKKNFFAKPRSWCGLPDNPHLKYDHVLHEREYHIGELPLKLKAFAVNGLWSYLGDVLPTSVFKSKLVDRANEMLDKVEFNKPPLSNSTSFSMLKSQMEHLFETGKLNVECFEDTEEVLPRSLNIFKNISQANEQLTTNEPNLNKLGQAAIDFDFELELMVANKIELLFNKYSGLLAQGQFNLEKMSVRAKDGLIKIQSTDDDEYKLPEQFTSHFKILVKKLNSGKVDYIVGSFLNEIADRVRKCSYDFDDDEEEAKNPTILYVLNEEKEVVEKAIELAKDQNVIDQIADQGLAIGQFMADFSRAVLAR